MTKKNLIIAIISILAFGLVIGLATCKPPMDDLPKTGETRVEPIK